MTIHHPELAFRSDAQLDARLRPRHALQDLKISELGRKFVVFTPGGATIEAMVAAATRTIGNVATPDCVRRIISHNPDNIWAIARRARYDAGNPVAEGFFAFLMLNADGLRQLGEGTFNGADPDLSLLAGQSDRPAGIYSWAVYAPRGLAAAVPLVLEKVSSPLYQGVDMFSHSTTDEGVRYVEAIGFRRGAVINGCVLPHLHWLKRSPAQDPEPPIYDSYRTSNGPSQIGVAVARTLDDVLRVFSVRSAVYCAEQQCPHEEEFDGNDFSATHLLGYIGHEPAGCVRIRCFADFAKIERVAIKREFRKSRLVHRLIRAAIELCRSKGYRRLYGQPRVDLVRFYSHFGFRLLEGGKTFCFSDIDYTEVVLDLERASKALAVGADPYVLIRPEGRWHMPGILERSAQRGTASQASQGGRVEFPV
jgi:predicted GNAT family N-acyltransferase